jgi:hypothetical protein
MTTVVSWSNRKRLMAELQAAGSNYKAAELLSLPHRQALGDPQPLRPQGRGGRGRLHARPEAG